MIYWFSFNHLRFWMLYLEQNLLSMEVQKDADNIKELEFTVPDDELALFYLEEDQPPTCEKEKFRDEKTDLNSGNFLC